VARIIVTANMTEI